MKIGDRGKTVGKDWLGWVNSKSGVRRQETVRFHGIKSFTG